MSEIAGNEEEVSGFFLQLIETAGIETLQAALSIGVDDIIIEDENLCYSLAITAGRINFTVGREGPFSLLLENARGYLPTDD